MCENNVPVSELLVLKHVLDNGIVGNLNTGIDVIVNFITERLFGLSKEIRSVSLLRCMKSGNIKSYIFIREVNGKPGDFQF